MSLPYVIAESQVHPFNFYHQGQRLPALLFHEQVYILKQAFGSQARLDAYHRCYELNEIAKVLMTVGQAGYCLWTGLQAAVLAQKAGQTL